MFINLLRLVKMDRLISTIPSRKSEKVKEKTEKILTDAGKPALPNSDTWNKVKAQVEAEAAQAEKAKENK